MALEDDLEEQLLLTTAEAVGLVKRAEREKGTRFLVMLRLDAGIAGKPDLIYSDGCYSSLRLSRAEALGLVERMLNPVLEAKGGRIRMMKRTSRFPGREDLVSYWFN